MKPEAVDVHLLRGFEFGCRSGCALCCFTTPAVSPAERTRLLSIEPRLPLLRGSGGFGFIAARGDGGACSLLGSLRCRAHSARPFPCRSFPITVFLGPRIQAALVLSCPGLSLSGLERAQPNAPLAPPIGMDGEVASVSAELARPETESRIGAARREFERARSRFEREGRWADPARLGSLPVDRALDRLAEAGPARRPNDERDGIEFLPLTFDESEGRIAFAGTDDGWVILRLSEAGAPPERLGTFTDPPAVVQLTSDATRLLHGYLAYVAARDSFLGQTMHRLLDEPGVSLVDALEEELIQAASQVVTRGLLLERLHGRTGVSASVGSVLAGIRATDAELLDRPAVGQVL